jgi:hypothetical protein
MVQDEMSSGKHISPRTEKQHSTVTELAKLFSNSSKTAKFIEATLLSVTAQVTEVEALRLSHITTISCYIPSK